MSGQPPRKPDLSQYNYGAISSLVLTADRSALPRRDREPDGAPTSLAGMIDPREMGSRVQRQAPTGKEKKKKKAADVEKQPKRAAAPTFGFADIVEDADGLGYYRPRTAETREAFELILSSVHAQLGGQAQDIIRSAADAVLETLKNDKLKDFDKKKEIEELLGTTSTESFSQLVNLSKKITDYGADDEAANDPDAAKQEAEIDDDVGVAVVFEDEDESDEDEDEGFEIRDESDDEDGGAEKTDADDLPEGQVAEEELVIGGDAAATTKTDDEHVVSPHSVDAFWVQRQVSEIYPDPVTAADKATAILSILGSESSLRDCENQLMELFEYQYTPAITKFLKNREVVVWCTKLARSDADEKVNVEVAMREKGVGWIVRELAGDRNAKAYSSDAMDVDGAKPEVPKTATLAPGSTVQPKRTVDLESMAFSQGGHLMANKKVKLPDGSFKRARKGFEEIHIPAGKTPTVSDAEFVPVSAMPAWAREAFTVPKLNRVQSKLYPVAFGTDEPILLCAPTGAGKVRLALTCKMLGC